MKMALKQVRLEDSRRLVIYCCLGLAGQVANLCLRVFRSSLSLVLLFESFILPLPK